MKPLSNAEYWLPEGVNAPCTCQGHQHRSDSDGSCDKPNDNDPQSWGSCACQHSSVRAVTIEMYQAWQADIRAGKIGPNDRPGELGISCWRCRRALSVDSGGLAHRRAGRAVERGPFSRMAPAVV